MRARYPEEQARRDLRRKIVFVSGPRQVAKTRADPQGGFSNVQITIPGGYPANWQATIIATGQSSVRTATQPFQIS